MNLLLRGVWLVLSTCEQPWRCVYQGEVVAPREARVTSRGSFRWSARQQEAEKWRGGRWKGMKEDKDEGSWQASVDRHHNFFLSLFPGRCSTRWCTGSHGRGARWGAGWCAAPTPLTEKPSAAPPPPLPTATAPTPSLRRSTTTTSPDVTARRNNSRRHAVYTTFHCLFLFLVRVVLLPKEGLMTSPVLFLPCQPLCGVFQPRAACLCDAFAIDYFLSLCLFYLAFIFSSSSSA